MRSKKNEWFMLMSADCCEEDVRLFSAECCRERSCEVWQRGGSSHRMQTPRSRRSLSKELLHVRLLPRGSSLGQYKILQFAELEL